MPSPDLAPAHPLVKCPRCGAMDYAPPAETRRLCYCADPGYIMTPCEQPLDPSVSMSCVCGGSLYRLDGGTRCSACGRLTCSCGAPAHPGATSPRCRDCGLREWTEWRTRQALMDETADVLQRVRLSNLFAWFEMQRGRP